MRGTPIERQECVSGDRIIPADAGNTIFTHPFRHSERDHPRGCGEHMAPPNDGASYWGSSPRMRGTPVKSLLAVGHNRIIPADAGNTPFTSDGAVVKRDHPRGCGEHQSLLVAR